MCVFTGNRPSYDYKIHTVDNSEDEWEQMVASKFDEDGPSAKKLKVKILPSTLANDQFRVKPEKAVVEVEGPGTISSTGSSTQIKIEIKPEPDSDSD